jgi:peptidyl-prolyl cis-trans isomerase D
MVKPFEDAVFAAKAGDIVGPVQTDFGYHVIKVTGITPSHVQSFDEVKGRIEADVRRQKAAQKFASAADQFQNLVYEQADSLAGAAKALDLKLETTQFLTRAQVQALALGSQKFMQAVFSPESISSKRNTEAMEVAPNALMAGRVVEYKPAAPRPLAEVQDEIRRQLTQKAASELAQQAGREKLALLVQGKEREAGLSFGKPVTLLRNQPPPGIAPEAVKTIFEEDPRKLPRTRGGERRRRLRDLQAGKGDRRARARFREAAGRGRAGRQRDRPRADERVSREPQGRRRRQDQRVRAREEVVSTCCPSGMR